MLNENQKTKLKHEDITSNIIGASIQVHKILKNGFQELIYQRALEVEMKERKILFEREKEMFILYKNINIGNRRVDFLIENKILLEIKAIEKLENVHIAQALNYLEIYNLEIGLLINFGGQSLFYIKI